MQVGSNTAGSRQEMEIEVDGAPNQQNESPDEASDNVMYFRTIMKSPVRKASTVVRSREAGQKAVHLVVSSKESCLEVIKDSAHELIHLFDENVFGTIWDLKVHNYDFIAREDIELMVLRQAISVEHVTSARLPDAFQGFQALCLSNALTLRARLGLRSRPCPRNVRLRTIARAVCGSSTMSLSEGERGLLTPSCQVEEPVG